MKGMKTIKNTTIYKCKYCSKIYVQKFYAEKHHFSCRKNPKNISPCLDFCKYLERKEFEVLCSSLEHEWYDKKKSFYCEKKNIYLRPRWSSLIDDYFCSAELPYIKIMPKNCKSYNCKEMLL